MSDNSLPLILDAIGDVRNDVYQVRLEHREDSRRVNERLERLEQAVARLDVNNVLPSNGLVTTKQVATSVGGGAFVVMLIELLPRILQALG